MTDHSAAIEAAAEAMRDIELTEAGRTRDPEVFAAAAIDAAVQTGALQWAFTSEELSRIAFVPSREHAYRAGLNAGYKKAQNELEQLGTVRRYKDSRIGLIDITQRVWGDSDECEDAELLVRRENKET